MTIQHKRFSITMADLEVATFVEAASKEKNKSLSSTIQDLLKIAMEIDDDYYWSKKANEAESENDGKPSISLEQARKECGLV